MEKDQLKIEINHDDIHSSLQVDKNDSHDAAQVLFVHDLHGEGMDQRTYTAEGEDEVGSDEAAEVLVVDSTNTVVQPVTVVVEFFTAAVARPTVLSPWLDVALTYDAEMLNVFFCVWPNRPKLLFENLQFTLLLHQNVCGYTLGADIGKSDCV